jgi:hypothetical protein
LIPSTKWRVEEPNDGLVAFGHCAPDVRQPTAPRALEAVAERTGQSGFGTGSPDAVVVLVAVNHPQRSAFSIDPERVRCPFTGDTKQDDNPNEVPRDGELHQQ